MRITFSMKKGLLPPPADQTCHPIDYVELGKVLVRLCEQAERVLRLADPTVEALETVENWEYINSEAEQTVDGVVSDPDDRIFSTLTTTSLEAAEARLGTTHTAERKGVLVYLDDVPIKEVDPERDLGVATRKAFICRLTMSGAIIKCPDGQTKTDLERWDNVHDLTAVPDGKKKRLQFKTATASLGYSFFVNLRTTAGRSGKVRFARNQYGVCDNDEYIVVLPSEAAGGTDGECHYWILDETEMINRNLVDRNLVGVSQTTALRSTLMTARVSPAFTSGRVPYTFRSKIRTVSSNI